MFIKRGFYDVTTIDENNDISVTDVMDVFDKNDGDETFVQKILSENSVIKCNICNYTFINIVQFLLHNDSKDHMINFLKICKLNTR